MRYAGDVALGLVVAGARAGRVALMPLRLAARVPVVGAPLQAAGEAFAADGRVVRYRLEAIAVEQLSSPELEWTIDRIVAAVLNDERTERMIERALASPGLERMLVRILDSELVDALTERVLASPELQLIVSHVASSPEVMDALSHQTETLADEMVTDVRQRAQRVDDLAERAVRGWLRRPRPRPA
jgi:uncharacterized membrane-anchored protein YjiN (DUF445 family)